VKRLLVFVALAVSLLAGCTATEPDATEPVEEPFVEASGPVTVTDLAGREVTVPAEVERVVAIGSGSLRLVVYAGGLDKVVGVEQFEKDPPVRRPYTLAYPALLDLPVIGAGGPNTTPDAERLLAATPDVIFASTLVDVTGADELQAATGIPVVVVDYGNLSTIAEPFFMSMELVGEVLGTTDRSAEVVTYVHDVVADLAERTAGLTEADKPTAYVGALGRSGSHGIDSTQTKYFPFEAIGAANVAAAVEPPGSVTIDPEQLLMWDPMHIFVDVHGLKLVREDAATEPALYQGLSAVREGRVYTQLPVNSYFTNIEVALADAYYTGTVLFPERFADVDPVAKADEIALEILGQPVYERLVGSYGRGYGSIDLLSGE